MASSLRLILALINTRCQQTLAFGSNMDLWYIFKTAGALFFVGGVNGEMHYTSEVGFSGVRADSEFSGQKVGGSSRFSMADSLINTERKLYFTPFISHLFCVLCH